MAKGAILTKAGRAELLNSPVLSKEVKWATIVVGDGNGSMYVPTEDQTQLRNQVWSGAIQEKILVKDNLAEFRVAIPAEVGPFIIREAGILNDQGILVAVMPVEEQNKVSITGQSGTINDMDFRIGILVDNAEIIQVDVDPNVVIATRSYVDEKVNSIWQSLEYVIKADETGYYIEEVKNATA